MKRQMITVMVGLLFAVTPAQSPRALEPDRSVPQPPQAQAVPIALLVDIGSGQVLFQREADRRFMPASITKVMTTFVAFELIEQERLHPETVLQVSERTAQDWRRIGSTMFLDTGDRVTVDDLLHGITTVSANDGSAALAEGAGRSVASWVALMNGAAVKLGMHDSHFGTPNGWTDGGQTYVTARDLATLGTAMITRHPSKFRHFYGKREFTYNGITQSNHDPITGRVAGADGIKTGFTNDAGYGFLGTAQRGGRRLMMVVAGVDSARARDQAAVSFMEWGFASFGGRRLFPTGHIVGSARVQDGNAADVGLRLGGPLNLSVPQSSQANVRLRVVYDGPIQAPFTTRDAVADLEVSIDGMPPYLLPLYPDRAVGRANPAWRVLNGLAGMFR